VARPISHLLQEQGFLTIVQDWKGVFRHFDHDGSGTIDGQELRSALNQFGYNLSPQLLSLVQRKYGACVREGTVSRAYSMQMLKDRRHRREATTVNFLELHLTASCVHALS
jgi:Ca2+-binding EF-hand superfamily protein